jgi:hypothetical protein
MSNAALEEPVTEQAVTQSNASHFGIAIMVLLAVACAVVAFQHPGMLGVEYQPVDRILADR